MFTGLIQETGNVTSVRRVGGGNHVSIAARRSSRELKVSDSVAVSGVCLTVIEKRAGGFAVEAVEETLRKTTLGGLSKSSRVNLELPMKLDDRIGGHLVLGHVDCFGAVTSVVRRESSRLITIEFPREFGRYVIPVGSIAVDGVSLTIASTEGNRFAVSVIPHTLEMTTLGDVAPGAHVNLEFDLVGKYIERLLGEGKDQKREGGLSREKLAEWGYGDS